MEGSRNAFFRILMSACLLLAGADVFAQSLVVDAGKNTGICPGGGPVPIGGAPTASGGGPPYTYSWSPTTGLNNPNIANPTAYPSVPTTYTVTVTDTAGSKVDSVKVDIFSSPTINAGSDVTINEGERAELLATGGIQYYWSPPVGLKYTDTPNPDAEPINTTDYIVVAIDANGCWGTDTVRVNVIKNDDIYLYNTFTPNNDGDNDTWYIGNIHKYPNNKLQVFSRYGKLVFIATPYMNHWDGKNFGEDVSSGTYYYILDLGNGAPPYTGSVTIIR